MTQTTILANARLVLADEVISGSLTFADGVITSVDQGTNVPTGAIDCDGDYVVPGLVELHTDNLERHLSPRPGVNWPHNAAIAAHDAELASTGITTVFDAVRLGFIEYSGTRNVMTPYARSMVSEILTAREHGLLKISHHIHLRAEICSNSLADELEEFGPEDRIGIISLMDHTPGQRQFADISQYEKYMRGKHGLSQQEFDEHVAERKQLRERVVEKHEAAAVNAAAAFGAVLASHDDTTHDHVERSAEHGIKLAEFPTTIGAAHACHAHGIAIMMGAPNLVRGGSHSGNVAAHTLAEHDLLDIVSSDYVPSALLYSALKLSELWDDMPRAVQTVTSAPAKAVNLDDRGTIANGLRADLVRFHVLDDVPLIRGVWSNGVQVG
ncbi:alpha-D-ribose 1-methylphosphonate 5-triphosphate diphosphatase [Ahrensia marina]|uniref:alpha-D-ribose 1-methylphosphonate 5-triphosphate diphosphatase n=1 Tax=Ahrensia marina TaxID=1514904 RepID=UPI0035D0B56F